jgi:NADH-quinone oxidoreductase subunit L
MSHASAAVHASNGAAHVAAADAHGHGGHGHDDAHGHGAAAHDDHDDAAHGHGHHGGPPHESPWTITLVLSLLAIGSGLTLFLGIPAAWTGKAPILEHWLEPVVVATNDVASRFALIGDAHHHHQMELIFQGVGVAIAFIGWLAARALYKDNKHEAALLANIERFKGVWTLVYNKYFVDELYQKTVLKPSIVWARICSWFDGHIIDALVNLAGKVTVVFANIDGAIDKYLVDGLVNAVADGTAALGKGLRLFQTGRVQTYLYGALGGALVVVLINFLIQ